MATVTTAAILPTLTAQSGSVWATPASALSDTDANASAQLGNSGSAGAFNGTLDVYGFAILQSDGGPVPDGATIVNVNVTARLRVFVNGSIAPQAVTVDAVFGKNRATTPSTSTAQPAVTLSTAGGVTDTDSGFVSKAGDVLSGATEASPQTFFTAADLASSGFFIRLHGTKASGGNGGFAQVDYARVTVTYVPAAQTVSPGGIASSEVFGQAKLGLFALPAGLASSEAFGAAAVAPGLVTLTPSPVVSGEAFGTPTALPGPVATSPAGVPSAEAFGTPAITRTVSATGVPSGEATGTPTVTPGAVSVTPAGVGTVEAFGSPAVTPGPVAVSPGGIASGEAFSQALVSEPQTVSPSGVASGEQIGVPNVIAIVTPAAIGTAEALGTPIVMTGPVVLTPAAIASIEAFGTAVARLAFTYGGAPAGFTYAGAGAFTYAGDDNPTFTYGG